MFVVLLFLSQFTLTFGLSPPPRPAAPAPSRRIPGEANARAGEAFALRETPSLDTHGPISNKY